MGSLFSSQFTALMLAGTALGAPAAAQDAEPTASHEAAVRAAVMDYFEGGNTGDSDRVARAFETEVGDMFIRRTNEAGADIVTTTNLGEFAGWFANPMPFERYGEIQDIRIVDDQMAFVHLAFTTPDRQFDDFFVLYRLGEDWKIVSKAYTVEPIEE
jgi:hypothetical protein